jgi:uncharacterized protein (DUF58 family)
VDASASMGYRTGTLSKLEVATTLAGALSYLLVRQQDAAGLTVLGGGGVGDIPPRSAAGHLMALLGTLEQLAPQGGTNLQQAADHLAERLPRRAMVVVFSDLFDETPDALRRILQLRARKHDVAVFQILDPAELEFPFDDPTLFLSMEDDRRLEVNAREIRESYLEELGTFLSQTKQLCVEADVDYQLVRTDEPLDAVLLGFLAKRQGRRR